MSPRGVWLVGAGKRVRETAYPAFCAEPGAFEVRGVLARSARTLQLGEAALDVQALDSLRTSPFEEGDLIYVAVGKDAVPRVLDRLLALGAAEHDLLIDTPVVRFKHYRHASKLARFQRVWVAEDVAFLPWLPAVQRAVAAGAIGKPRALHFEQSAYAYHGVALAKAVLGSPAVRSGRRVRLGGRFFERRWSHAGGARVRVLEPRDYASGRFLLVGERGSLGDYPLPTQGHVLLAPQLEGECCTGFTLGTEVEGLTAVESELLGPVAPGTSVTALTEATKRVGFARLLRAIAAGEGGYPLDAGLDDMVVDYHLEKLGRYAANPFTSHRGLFSGPSLGLLTRFGG